MTVVRRRRSKRSKKATLDVQPTSAPRTAELVRPSQPTNRRQAGETSLDQPGNSGTATTKRAETSSTSQPLSTAARRYRYTLAAYRALAEDSDSDMDSDEEVDSAIGQPGTAALGEVAAAILQLLTPTAPVTVTTPAQEPDAINPLSRLAPPHSAGSEDVDMDDRSEGGSNGGSGF
ncbi:hypothetical protein PF005_g8896 [Phytophthora fragariae]|uniref:Uncharacterized protein n=1 Tax=Phytophthora fragariae TaxID=53985 RepID=A0A6A3YDK0_9STRA|nr:hypothetical protein PF003_g3000 [Phytophthora fragariae]KAE8940060.1 hypothetical protein PF009_g10114 [Phytophthora fragariae]KAE8989241.1 hypothetical protein PF011_g18850 [Phytophthora fragariae]KAE9087638.1 hypothetical protein PF007_g20292 [Phytophthora fragariae]KAE9118791.1 hypothetical protein PF010_g8093 [Phytophthora fragariae]